MPFPVLVSEPSPLITPVLKIAVPPVAAVNSAVLLTTTLPVKVAVPASSIPRTPEPLATSDPIVVNAILSNRLLPVELVAPVKLNLTKDVLSPFNAKISLKDFNSYADVETEVIVPADVQLVPSLLYSQT